MNASNASSELIRDLSGTLNLYVLLSDFVFAFG